jgi:hypothetical protein
MHIAELRSWYFLQTVIRIITSKRKGVQNFHGEARKRDVDGNVFE